jgi:glutathione synthase/RimK-type ligase-like ATP-grasp enzyme
MNRILSIRSLSNMADRLCLGVRRHPMYSPGHVEGDTRILQQTAEALRRRGYPVEIRDETDLGGDIPARVIFTMAQSPEGVRRLGVLQRQGRVVVNSPESIRNCRRTRMIPLLQAVGVPLPRSRFVDLRSGLRRPAVFPESGRVWVKRGDVHATEPGDVVAVDDERDLTLVLERFRQRGLYRVLIQAHVVGDLVKFYAVRGTPFFFWHFPASEAQGRVDPAVLRHWATRAAEALGLDVYGGDAIVTPDGSVVIIDVNDWPSFGPCAEEAAPYIADRILQRARAAGVIG